MKTKSVYRIVMLAGWVGVFACAEVRSEVGDEKGVFKCKLEPQQTRIQPYDPVYLKCSLRNSSNRQQTITGHWQHAVYLKKGDTGEWNNYSRPSKVQARPLPPSAREFAAGEGMEEIIVIDVKFSEKHAFAEPGTYWVKIRLAGMESTPVSVIVQPPPDGEKMACRYLDDHPLYWFFTDEMAKEHLDDLKGKDPIKELTKYVELYPSSRYAQWARLGLLWVKKARAGDDPDAVAEVRRDMEKEATVFPAPMDAMAWYEAGVAAYRLGDDAGADANFNRAMTVDKQVFAREQIERVKHGRAYIRRLKVEGKAHAQEPVKPVAQGDREDVEKTVRQFMAAHREGRIEECAGMMTEDFVRGRMDRTKSLAKMQKEFEKLKGKKLDAEPTFDSVTTDGTNVTVAISVVYRLEGEQRSQKESYTLRQEQGQWKVSRQEVTYKEPPPGFPPQPPAPKQ